MRTNSSETRRFLRVKGAIVEGRARDKCRSDTHPSKRIFLEGEENKGHGNRRDAQEGVRAVEGEKTDRPHPRPRTPPSAHGRRVRASPLFTFKEIFSSSSVSARASRYRNERGEERVDRRLQNQHLVKRHDAREGVEDPGGERGALAEEPARREEDEGDRRGAEQDLDDAGERERRPRRPRGNTRRAGSRNTARRLRRGGGRRRPRRATRGARRRRCRCRRAAGGAGGSRSARAPPPSRRALRRAGETGASSGRRLPPPPC